MHLRRMALTERSELARRYGDNLALLPGSFLVCALSTSITWGRTPHPARGPAFSSHLISSVVDSSWDFFVIGVT